MNNSEKQLPYADFSNYGAVGGDIAKNVDLLAAERNNKAVAAQEIGLSLEEWENLRRELGRSPVARDVSIG